MCPIITLVGFGSAPQRCTCCIHFAIIGTPHIDPPPKKIIDYKLVIPLLMNQGRIQRGQITKTGIKSLTSSKFDHVVQFSSKLLTL